MMITGKGVLAGWLAHHLARLRFRVLRLFLQARRPSLRRRGDKGATSRFLAG